MSTTQRVAKDAVARALSLLRLARRDCVGVSPTLPLSPPDFHPGANHTHHVRVHRRYTPNCHGETLRLRFSVEVPGAEDRTIVLAYARHEFATGAWVLESSPPACEI